MDTLLAFIVGGLFTAGTYLALRRNLLRFVFGLVLLGNGANLLVFTAGRTTRGAPPLVREGMLLPEGAFANPLPQALVLTAIVIAFGLTAFALVLVLRGYTALGSAEADALDMPAVPEPTPLAVAREETLAPDGHPASPAHDESVSPSGPPERPARPGGPPAPPSTLA